MTASRHTPFTPPDDPSEWQPETAARLLALGRQGPRRPLDDLLDRLDEEDGDAWIRWAIAEAAGPDAFDELLGGAPESHCATIKECGKACLAQTPTPEARLCGLATYFVSIASGLAHHGTLIGGPSREDVNAALHELASATTGPLASLLLTAVRAAGGAPSAED